jgi:predicted O-linked N-acetylglucosamine transferase (SPINDLY family)
MGAASLTQSINLGVEYLQSGQPDKAVQHYKKLLYRFPNQPDALHLLAVAVYQLGDSDGAIKYAERAAKANPRSADYLSNLGRYYLANNRAEEATVTLQAALELNRSHSMALYNLAAALIAQSRKGEALPFLAEFVKLEPGNPSGHLTLGNLYAEQRRQEQAAECYRTALIIDPNIAEAHNNLGNSLQALGNLEPALACYQAALSIRPDYPDALSNKGATLQGLGRSGEALACFQQALKLDPRFIQARGNLANLLAEQNQQSEAILAFKEILADSPGSFETWNNLGNCYQQLGHHAEAAAAYGEALRRNPGYFLVHNNIGNSLRKQGRYEEAIASYQTALRADPCFVEAMNNLGVALQDKGNLLDAVPWFEKALSIKPLYADPLINLANNWRDRGRPEEAIRCLRRALELAPANPHVWNNLGCALGDQGMVSEAIECYRKTLVLAPRNHLAYSNLLLNLHYTAAATREEVFEAHLDFARKYENAGANRDQQYSNSVDLDRPLRIGYVSADFRRHSVAFFLEPVLEKHNSDQCVAYLYADVARPDATTENFRKLANNRWRDIRGINASDFQQRVKADQIDILVDLGGHTANTRLLDFSTRPAPVQVSWLGYPDTTGLSSIDYRLTDALADPIGEADSYHTERLCRMEDGFLCFRPPADSSPIGELPCLKGEPLTFGSFNNCAKISAECMASWAEILKRVPGSRIAIKNKALSEQEARERLVSDFTRLGIPQHRIYMSGLVESLKGHLETYGIIDVALDTSPYHGTTTTCEALWMGVPVVSLIGSSHVSRVGLSLLNSIGARELSAATREEYIGIAVRLASDREALSLLRSGLRDRMRLSPLMDETGFTRRLEAVFRTIWQKWCAKNVLQT